jgi:5-methyltetrahydropteroyltriglutamate--homocysteine methyltransferase
MTVTTHLCRGNFRSSWVARGGYEFVADALFNELNVDG